MTDLHPAVQEKLDWFNPEHFGSDLKWVVGYCRDLAFIMSAIPSHPQLTLGLQHLIEAQDCFVKALMAGQKADVYLLAPAVATGANEPRESTDFPGTPFGRGDTITIITEE